MRSFEWIIIDDGSSDNTAQVVRSFQDRGNDFDIIYKYQENQGKHIATNRAVKQARGELFITIDSDDCIKDNALQRLTEEWAKLPDEEKPKYKGIACRTCDENGRLNGNPLPENPLDCSDLDLRFKYKIEGECWGMSQTAILLENPYPEVEGLHFYPENIYWNNIGRRYSTRFIDEPLRIYYSDQSNALTSSSNASFRETYHMRLHFLNECADYLRYKPAFFAKQAVGLWRDGKLCGKKASEIFGDVKTAAGRFLAAAAFPVGMILAKK